MITVNFKNVGQGDSIIIEWENKGKKSIGIIDCKVYNEKNPILEYLQQNLILEIEFILLSHLHYDHFSGMADIFEFCINRKIKTKYFFHTNAPFIGEIYNRIFTSQKLQRGIKRFIEYYELFDKLVGDKIQVTCHLRDYKLTDNIILKFIAPKGRTYDIMSKQLSRKVNKISTSKLDINKIATITCIQNNKDCILLTSDATLGSYKKIDKKIERNVVLSQVPHHGSYYNIYPRFWTSIKRDESCPAVFSVGYEPKDKLPDKSTVEFFHNNKFDIHSTNSVYGISEFFKIKSIISESLKSLCLNNFSVLRNVNYYDESIIDKYNGDKKFEIKL